MKKFNDWIEYLKENVENNAFLIQPLELYNLGIYNESDLDDVITKEDSNILTSYTFLKKKQIDSFLD